MKRPFSRIGYQMLPTRAHAWDEKISSEKPEFVREREAEDIREQLVVIVCW
jgi:hypothetical protein